jgi:hypothetical protein
MPKAGLRPSAWKEAKERQKWKQAGHRVSRAIVAEKSTHGDTGVSNVVRTDPPKSRYGETLQIARVGRFRVADDPLQTVPFVKIS